MSSLPQSQEALRVAPVPVVADALRAWAACQSRTVRGAVQLLVDFGDGALLASRDVRDYLRVVPDTEGLVAVRWLQMHAALDQRPSPITLPASTRAALLLACHLARGPLADILGVAWSVPSRRVMLAAFTTALDVPAGQEATAQTTTAGPRVFTPGGAPSGGMDDLLGVVAEELRGQGEAGATPLDLVRMLAQRGIDTQTLTVTAALGVLAASTRNVVQHEPHGCYFWVDEPELTTLVLQILRQPPHTPMAGYDVLRRLRDRHDSGPQLLSQVISTLDDLVAAGADADPGEGRVASMVPGLYLWIEPSQTDVPR